VYKQITEESVVTLCNLLACLMFEPIGNTSNMSYDELAGHRRAVI